MASLLSGEPSHHGPSGGNYKASQVKPEEGGGRWYFSRKEIEENSPSRQDGIDLKKETYLRKSYCTFLQDLGMRLKVPQVTIATAIIFCHRFFLRQSHAKNDRRTIATVCMFLAGKVEETPRPLKDVILVSYEIIHKKDPAAVQRIKQKEVYEQQKELVLLGERVVLVTLGFDLNIQHPYKPLVEAIKKFQVAQNALAQVAWNFVNDGLRTSLCLQFKPHHIAAGAIFLAAKFLKVKLPSDGEKVWWQEFDVTPRQLEEVSNQMLELYEQNKNPQSQASEAEGSAGGSQRPFTKGPGNEEHATGYSSSHGGASSKASSSKPAPSKPAPDPQDANNHHGPSRTSQARNNDYGSAETSTNPERRGDDEFNDIQHHGREVAPLKGNAGEIQNRSKLMEGHGSDDQEGTVVQIEPRDAGEMKDKYHGRSLNKDSKVSQAPHDATKKLDKEKIKAAFERRKARGDINKMDPMDELERELEDVEVPGENEKTKRERKQSWSKPSNRSEHENSHHTRYANEGRDDFDAVEEGEVAPSEEVDRGYRSPRKRKPGSPLERNGLGRPGYSERDHKRHLQENHV
ncbi:cyclin-T1-3-like [Andrographis paniculata]|uniref:cyclin-T1-3-like n=1 Tax=Andrographis paniculata TaxID=175694 RepID=UPI0021E979DB|nr:cyclin-T1-3-like [Andrographis paniculata]XP_051145964.1 cyclin-T1-3-like [Andrographis paniculata]XP_051145965.1 cyclin-T1-3-like [Andrographis paniculata]